MQSLHSDDKFVAYRSQLLNQTIGLFAIVSSINFIFTIQLSIQIGWQPYATFQAIAVVLFISVWLMRNNLSYHVKIISLLSGAYIIVFATLANVGPIAHSKAGVIVLLLIAGVFLDQPYITIVMITIALGLFTVGLLAVYNIITFQIIDYEIQAHSVTTWINISIALIASGSVVAWIARSTISELISSRKEAEAANRAKSQFLANVSHELRTPLNTILGFTNVLLEQPESLTPTQREQLTIIAHSGNSLRRLIDDILDLVRADSERLKLHQQATELLPIIKSIIDTVRPDCERKGLNLHVSIPELLTPLLLDGERLRQIILNLLNNAIKFTPQGEIGLTINYQIIDEAHIDLMMTVTDTGPGISLMDQARIFLPFEQVNKEGHTNVNGLGLGLAICQQLTKLMGGKLLINSIAGQGSTFILKLPVMVTLKSPMNPLASIVHFNYSAPIAIANLTANDLPLDTDLAMLLELAEVRMISELQDWIQVNMDSYPQFTKLLDELVRSCDLPKVEAFLKNIYERS